MQDSINNNSLGKKESWKKESRSSSPHISGRFTIFLKYYYYCNTVELLHNSKLERKPAVQLGELWSGELLERINPQSRK